MNAVEAVYQGLANGRKRNDRLSYLHSQGVYGPAAEQQLAQLAANDLENDQRSQYAAQEEARQDERAKQKQDEARAAQQPSRGGGNPAWADGGQKQVVQAKPVDTMGRELGANGKPINNFSPGVPTNNMGAYGGMKQQPHKIFGANNAPGTIGSEPQQPGMTSVNALTKAGVLSTEERSNLKRFGKAIGRPVNPNAQFKVPDANVQGYMDQFFRR